MSLDEVFEKVNAAHLREDWREVLKWEGRKDEMMERQPDAACNNILGVFASAHRRGFKSTVDFSHDHSLSIVRLETRRVEVLGRMQRFRDQGEVICVVADHLRVLGTTQEAAGNFQRARKLGEAHGFFLLECESCFGLGNMARAEGRDDEGLVLLRHALVFALCEGDANGIELRVLHAFTDALFQANAIDEVEPLVARFREVAQTVSDKQGRPCFGVFHSLYTSAQLHEVLCTCTPRVGSTSHCWTPALYQGR